MEINVEFLFISFMF